MALVEIQTPDLELGSLVGWCPGSETLGKSFT